MRSGEIGREVRREGSIVRVGEPKPVTLAPSVSKILTTAATSEIWGTLWRVTGEPASRVAGRRARIEFLLPEMVMWPDRGVGPVTRYLVMPGYYSI